MTKLILRGLLLFVIGNPGLLADTSPSAEICTPTTAPLPAICGPQTSTEEGEVATGSVAADQSGRPDKAIDNPTNAEPAGTSKGLELIGVGRYRDQSWRRQLPVIKSNNASQPDDGAGDDRSPISIQTGLSAPVPETAFPEWGDNKQTGTSSPPVSDISPQGPPTEHGAVTAIGEHQVESPVAVLSKSPLNNRFTVQLGAFATFADAQRFIAEHKLLHLDIVNQTYESDGRKWHILTFGQFEDIASAKKAWAQASENHRDIGVWVRAVRH